MIRGAVFDLDGTLLDSNPYWARVPVVYLASFGKKAEPDIAKTVFSMTLPEAREYLIRKYDLKVSPEEFSSGIAGLMENFYRSEIPMKAGVPGLLGALKERGISCAMARPRSSRRFITIWTAK